MKGKTKKGIALLTVAAMAVLSTGCGAKKEEAKSLTLALMVNGHSVPMYIAQQDGIMEQNGLTDVKAIYFGDGATENEALGSGEWEVGSMGNMPAIAGGIAYNSHVISPIVNEDVAVDAWVREGTDIANTVGKVAGHEGIHGTADQWRGLTILVPTSTGAHWALGVALNDMGLSLADVEIISMNVSQCFTAFQSGQGDAMVIWPPNSYYAEEAGFVKAWSGVDLGLDIPGYMVASEKALQEKPEEVAAALKSCFEAVDKYKNDPKVTGEYMQKMSVENGVDYDLALCERFCKERPNYALEDNIKYFEGEYGSRKIDKSLGDVIDFLVNEGLYTEEDKQKLIDNNFIDSTIVDMIAAKK